jgi:hypothetical protein
MGETVDTRYFAQIMLFSGNSFGFRRISACCRMESMLRCCPAGRSLAVILFRVRVLLHRYIPY